MQVAIETSASQTAEKHDWPFIRGPHYDGHSSETDVLDEFPPQGPRVLWTRPLGVGYSGFTAQGERVFTQYQNLGGQYVVCLNAATGKTIWEYRYELPYDPAGMYPGPRATPTLANGRVYFASPAGQVGCLSIDKGLLLWQINLFKQFQTTDLVEFGYSCSPVVVHDRVLLPVGTPNASMVALDANSGQPIWQSGNDAISHVPAMPIEFHGRQLVIGYFRNSLTAFDFDTGALVGHKDMSVGYDEHAAWPIYQEPFLWLSGPFRAGSELLELTDDPIEPRTIGFRSVWQSKLMSNDVCSSVFVNGHLYGFDVYDPQTKPHRPTRGAFRCMEYLSGLPRWMNETNRRHLLIPSNDPASLPSPELSANPQPVGHASVIYADGKLILLNDLGQLILARASPDRYEEIGRSSVLAGELCWTPPMLSRGRLFVRNSSRVVCIALSQAEQVPAAGESPLTVADIPQSVYRDWASVLLAVELEFAMDAPVRDQLWLWLVASLFLLLSATALSALSIWIANTLGWTYGPDSQKRLSCGLAFVMGALGTTFLSSWRQEFVFTWPLSLFVMFETTVTRAVQSCHSSSRWNSRLPLIFFVVTCGAYFWLCRRLSLAFEWVFLTAFIGAVPLLAWQATQDRRYPLGMIATTLSRSLAFSLYYLVAVAVLWWKYGVGE